MVQNGCSFHKLRYEDPNQHLKDFLKLVDSLDLDVANRERARLRLFQFSLRYQARNWLERLLARSISTWEDLTTRFLAQFFPPRRTIKLRNDILIFQQHQAADGKLRDKNTEESRALLEDLAHYDNESWNDPRDFAKPVKAIYLPQDVPSTSDRRLIELENQVQRLMKAHLAPKSLVQVNKIASSCEICSGPHDTQYCMENPEQPFVEYTSSRNNEVGGKQFTTNQGPRNFNEATNAWKDKPNFNWARTQSFTSPQNGSFSTLGTQLKQQQDDAINKINTLWKVVSEKFDNTPAHDNTGDSMTRVNVVSVYHPESDAPLRKGIKNPSKLLSPKYQSQSSLGEQNRSFSSSPKRVYFVKTITVIRKDDEFKEACTIESDAAEDNGRDTIVEGEKEIGEGLDSSKLVIKEDESRDIKRNDPDDRTCGETKEVEEVKEEKDTTSVIYHYPGGMVLGKPFVKETGLVYNKEEGTVMFEKGNEKIIFKMPHKMERFKYTYFEEIKTDCIPPFIIEGNDDDHEKTHYSDNLNLGPAYRRDESVTKAI
ncbi:MAK10-like protein [Tanacetum coccineum]